MSKNQSLSNFCSILQNGQLSRKLEVQVRGTFLNRELLRTLTRNGYIRGSIPKESGIIVLLKYIADKPAITEIKPVLNQDVDKLLRIKMLRTKFSKYRNLDTTILSTSKGIMSKYEAISKNLGGRGLIKIF